MEEASRSQLPDEYLMFLKENEINPVIYSMADSIPRYIRLKPKRISNIKELEGDLKCKLEEVDWLANFYAISPHIQIAKSQAYLQGQIYGIDAASGAAVTALNISEGDHVLDLCTAPGAKLCMILDLLGPSGSVTGVDISMHRLASCRTMVRKYALGNRCRLFIADGTTFDLPPTVECCSTSTVGGGTEVFQEWMPKKRNYKERKRAVKSFQNSTSYESSSVQDPQLIFYGRDSGIVGRCISKLHNSISDIHLLEFGYDKVLVDAECTHDGSVRHVQKYEYWGWETLHRRLLNAERSDSLTQLQLKLLSNGFRLMKIGGTLVYSTCSLTLAQNEGVVEQFLRENKCAELQLIQDADNWPCKHGRLPHTLRFDPLVSSTSGLFVAKFTKKHM